jgi:hypothetical protein
MSNEAIGNEPYTKQIENILDDVWTVAITLEEAKYKLARVCRDYAKSKANGTEEKAGREASDVNALVIDYGVTTMTEWKEYRKKGTTPMREVTPDEIWTGELPENVSVSEEDKKAGSPKAGDMIARNKDNHDDMWLVAADYHEENYEVVTE